MGLIAGTISVARFTVGKESPELPEVGKTGLEKIKLFAFNGFAENQVDIETVLGWVPLDDPDHPELAGKDCKIESILYLSIREDNRKVPASLMRREMKARIAKAIIEWGRTVLARTEKDEIKTQIHRAFLDRALPSTGITDILFDMDRMEVFVFSASMSTTDTARTLFEKTFDRKIHRTTPNTMPDVPPHFKPDETLGTAFLRWLWARALSQPKFDALFLSLGERATLAEGNRSTTIHESLGGSKMAYAAMSEGLLPTRIQFQLHEAEGSSFVFVLDASFTIRSLKSGSFSDECEDDLQATILLNYGILRNIFAALDAAFAEFISDPDKSLVETIDVIAKQSESL